MFCYLPLFLICIGLNHSFKKRTGEVTDSLVHWSNQWLNWFNSDKKTIKFNK
jgi:hypothetical protein